MGNLHEYIITTPQDYDDVLDEVTKFMDRKIHATTIKQYVSFDDLKTLNANNESIQPGFFLGTLGQVRQLDNFSFISAKELI